MENHGTIAGGFFSKLCHVFDYRRVDNPCILLWNIMEPKYGIQKMPNTIGQTSSKPDFWDLITCQVCTFSNVNVEYCHLWSVHRCIRILSVIEPDCRSCQLPKPYADDAQPKFRSRINFCIAWIPLLKWESVFENRCPVWGCSWGFKFQTIALTRLRAPIQSVYKMNVIIISWKKYN